MGVNKGLSLPEGINFILEVGKGMGGLITIRVVGAPVYRLISVVRIRCWLMGGWFVGRCWGWFVNWRWGWFVRCRCGMVDWGWVVWSRVVGCGVILGCCVRGSQNGSKNAHRNSLHC